ncbi:MAG TPA: S9 family peptidase, partial [Ktedonosporobacter sp.]|nr:S9 family peptidase [Ktedonosporobacter sp.]
MDVPVTRRGTVIEDYHGTLVADPYRWLEEAGSEETQAWSEAQNAVTRAYLDAIPALERLKARFTELWDYPKYSAPRKEGGHYYFSKNTGLQNQSVLYRRAGLQGESQLVLDPNTLSEDGTVALTNLAVSKSGALLAYSTSASGSDRQEIKVRHVDSGREYGEMIKWVKFTNIAWRHDNRGFYYSRFPEPGSVAEEDENNFRRVYWHEAGTPQEKDQLVYERPEEKELGFDPIITHDGQYLLLNVWHGTDPKNRFYYREVASNG